MKIPVLVVLVLFALGLTACGGSNNTPPPPSGNFSNASLKGSYAFLMNGIDAKGAYFARVGSFAADGAGNISAALQDSLNLSSGQAASIISFTSGSYQIQGNGQGQLTLQSANGSLQFSLAMQSPSAGYLVQTDLAETCSGNFQLQTPSEFIASALNMPYVFSLSGVTFVPSAVAPIGLVGEFNPNGTGTITGGLMDTYNGNATPSGATAIPSGSYQIDSMNGPTFGRGTLTFAGYTFAFYIVDAAHIMILEEDSLGGTSGEAFVQSGPVPTQNSQFTGSFVYLLNGAAIVGNNKGPVTRAARFTADGNGGINSLSFDDNNDGKYTHISQGSNISNANYSIDTSNPGTGRGTFAFTDSGKGTVTNVFYVISSSQAVVLETSVGIVANGPLSLQTGGPFALSGLTGNFVFNWSGVQLGTNTLIPLQQDFVGRYTLSSNSGSNIAGSTDYVEVGLSGSSAFSGVDLGGQLTINGDGTANNRYKFAINGSNSTTINFQAYFVNPSTVYLICSDSNRTSPGIINQQQ